MLHHLCFEKCFLTFYLLNLRVRFGHLVSVYAWTSEANFVVVALPVNLLVVFTTKSTGGIVAEA